MHRFNRTIIILLLLAMAVACADTLPPPTGSPNIPDTAGETAVPAPATPPPPESTLSADTPPSTPAPPEQDGYAGTLPAPEFPPGLEWLNVAAPLTLADLRGKIVLLDFWTYGCINCLHVIPDLKRLEEKFADELVVIGVHSAKFSNEGETENIRQIIQRYEIAHPVINDNQFQVWQQYGVAAWPTFVLIDPRGNVLGYHAGEGIFDLFNQVIIGMIAQFDAEDGIDRTPLALKLESESLANSPLLFPGKVLADGENGRLFIADSSRNRIVVTDLDGVVLAVIGSGSAGFADGDFRSAAFRSPQGLTLADADTLYVADTGNHAVRRIDLAAGTVSTAAGTGVQGRYDTPWRGRSADRPQLPLGRARRGWNDLYRHGRTAPAVAV
jgi:thiol-disulfide isomerase/thioredoxin